MNAQDIEQQVKAILADKLDAAPEKITPDARLAEDLNMDSFAAIEMAFALEEKFYLKIPDSDIMAVKTVRDVVDYIQRRRG
ncbi:MAG: acyl carrier protein [Candidatus Omnitrophota bacterium]